MTRKYKKKAAFHALFLAVTAYAAAQADSSIFAPFVSNLQALADGASVNLSWKDSPSVQGPVFVYRSQRPYDGVLRHDDLLAEVYYGRQGYTDTVPSNTTWFYFVLASDEDKQRYEMIIPYNNMVEIRVDGAKHISQASALPEVLGAAPPNAAAFNTRAEAAQGTQYVFSTGEPPAKSAYSGPETLTLTALSASPEGSGLRVTFVSANPLKSPVIYRNIAPIMSLRDLTTSDVAQLPGAASPFLDQNVQKGIPYYYAVVYDEDIRAGRAFIAPGYNSTIYPATVSRDAYTPPVPAAAPPPVYIPQAVIPVPEGRSSRLSAEAEAALSRNGFMSPIPYQSFSSPAPFPAPIEEYRSPAPSRVEEKVPAVAGVEPRIFQRDVQMISSSADEVQLQNIIKDFFALRKWPETITALQQLLTTVRTQAVEIRCRYYLGQAYYFSGLYNNAMTEFLAVQSKLPTETAFWIQLTLKAIP
ncbi:MAG: hypothetical protein LBC77_05710 [Spirochaetaceae bacterium]|nr:hypothetical protein [Spirochaetaceae bacterium]